MLTTFGCGMFPSRGLDSALNRVHRGHKRPPRPRGGKERGATSDLGGRLGPGARYLQNLPTWALFRDVGLWPGRWRVSRPAPITAILISPAAFLAIAETLPLGAECLPFVLAARTQF